MFTARPPRHGFDTVQMNQRAFVGEMRELCMLPEAPTPQMLRRLIAGDQLVVSGSGSSVAFLFIHNESWSVFHSGFEHPEIAFSAIEQTSPARIIVVEDDFMTVWGETEGFPPGVWMLASGMKRFLYPMERLIGLFRAGSLCVPYGESSLNPCELSIFLSSTIVPINSTARVEFYQDNSLCVLEKLGDNECAYSVTCDEIRPFSSIPANMSPVAVLRHNGRTLLIDSGESVSSYEEIGRPKQEALVVSVDGRIVNAWSSPTGRKLVSLVKLRKDEENVHRICDERGKTVREGKFTLARDNLFWSRDGESFAARIVERGRERVVTPTSEIELPIGERLREVLVTDSGHVCAMIVNDGEWDKLFIGERVGTATSLAWNLHHDENGAVVWNTIYNDLILRWIDRTNLVDRVVVSETVR